MTASLEQVWRPRLAGAVGGPAEGSSRSLPRSRPRSRRVTGRSRRPVHHTVLPQLCGELALACPVAALLAPPRLATVFPLLWVLSLGSARGYQNRGVLPSHEDAQRVLRAGFGIAVTGAALAAVAAAPLPVSPVDWLLLVAVTASASLARRQLTRVWRARAATPRPRVVVVGPDPEVQRFAAELGRSSRPPVEVVATCVPPRSRAHGRPAAPLEERLAATVRRHEADAAVILPGLGLDSAKLRRVSWKLAAEGVEMLHSPGVVDVDGHRVTLVSAGPIPMLQVRPTELHGPRRAAAEAVSRLLAVLLLVVLVPALTVIAALVRLESPGPAFFRQVRVGRDGHRFVMWKFRTMAVDAGRRRSELTAHNQSDGPLFKIREDPRVTPLGRWLRRHSVDELPQLVNVVLGSMALVGPRPALPGEVLQYAGDVRRRLAVKPGMTGLWQVSGRSDLSWEEAVRLDLRYVDNWTPGLDVRILARTVRCVVRPHGAY